MVDGGELVVAVGARRPDAQDQVDFAGTRTARVSRGRHACHPTRPVAASRASRANSATPSASPRARVDPGRPQRPLGGAGEPAQPASAARRRLAPLGERGVDQGEHLLAGRPPSAAARAGRTRPGRSPRWVPARRPSGRPSRPAARRRTRPPSPRGRRRSASPGGAASRSATSACTITSPWRMVGSSLEQVQQHGHRDVVGQVRDQRGRRRAGQSSTRSASAVTTVEPVGRRPARARRRSRAAARRATGSISTAVTRRATVEQREGQRAEARTDLERRRRRRRARGARRSGAPCWRRSTKFCPSVLVGRDAQRLPRARAPRPARAATGVVASPAQVTRSVNRCLPAAGHWPAPLRL